MNTLSLDIKPKVGFGTIDFGFTIEQVVSILGEADDVEDIQEEEDFNTLIMNYWNMGFSVFVEGSGAEKSIVSCFETDNQDSVLFGEKVFKLKEQQIIDLMKSNGFNEVDTEKEDNGEYRLSLEDGMIDFFFENGNLTAVNWGVLVNEHGEIEEI